MAPLACFAIFPVSRVRVRPPTSTVTRCGAGVCVFSDMNHFLWTRIRAEHLEAVRRANGPLVYVGRSAAIHEEEQEARTYWKTDKTRRTTPRENPALK